MDYFLVEWIRFWKNESVFGQNCSLLCFLLAKKEVRSTASLQFLEKTDPLLRKYFSFTQNCSSSQQITTRNDPYLQTIIFSKKWSISTKTNMLLHKWIRSKNDPFLQKLIQSTKNWSSQPKTDPVNQNWSKYSKTNLLCLQKCFCSTKNCCFGSNWSNKLISVFVRQMIWVLLFMKGLSLLDDSTVNHD